MEGMKLYYATNRKHSGKDRWHPDFYGAFFSDDGRENLRFGELTVNVEKAKVDKYLNAKVSNEIGNGEGSSAYIAKCARSAQIVAYQEKIRDMLDIHQPNAKFGSKEMFNNLMEEMKKHSDVLIFIHGFNVSWYNAVGSALALQTMLNRPGIGDKEQKVLVVLFSWPSDGTAFSYVSYLSDRSDAKGSGYAFGRGILKLRDFLVDLSNEAKRRNVPLCGHNIHLLCHSMGNYVLQKALDKIVHFSSSLAPLPRIFEHIFLCAADVDDNILESNKPMSRLHELCQYVNIYYNQQDKALAISDYTKGNPTRLGTGGAAHPSLLHTKIHHVDCTPIVHGTIEHSYYLWGPVNEDIRLSIDGVDFDNAQKRRRKKDNIIPNVWKMC